MKNHIVNFIESFKNYIKNKKSSRVVHNKLKMSFLYHSLVRAAPDLKIQPTTDAYDLSKASLVFISLYNHNCYSVVLSTSYGIKHVTVSVSGFSITRNSVVLDYTDVNYVLTVIRNLIYRIDKIAYRSKKGLEWKTSMKNG